MWQKVPCCTTTPMLRDCRQHSTGTLVLIIHQELPDKLTIMQCKQQDAAYVPGQSLVKTMVTNPETQLVFFSSTDNSVPLPYQVCREHAANRAHMVQPIKRQAGAPGINT
jgi:hypothetical protein